MFHVHIYISYIFIFNIQSYILFCKGSFIEINTEMAKVAM